jgi:putative tryptophan/tyrosine transport system substrate-binding protein
VRLPRNSLFVAFRVLAAVAAPSVVGAQEAPKIPRIGFLSPAAQTYQDAFRRGLRELGYADGQNIRIEYRFGEGSDERLPALASDLASLPVDVIVATNTPATAAAIKATSTIPIVMVTAGDALRSKFVASLSHPGGNVTGLTSFSPETGLKQLELLLETVPNMSRVVVFWNPLNQANRHFLEGAQTAAQTLGVQLQLVPIQTPQDLKPAFEVAAQSNAHALLTVVDQVTIKHRAEVVHFANMKGLPAIYALREFVVAGGLMAYGVSFSDLYYRAAAYVDKILRGAKPADLPVERPAKFELVVNLNTAKALGLSIPDSVLARADEVIE